MKSGLLRSTLIASMLFSSAPIYADIECDCYMEYQSIESEAKVYEDENSKNNSVIEFSEKDRLEIEKATNLIADRAPTL